MEKEYVIALIGIGGIILGFILNEIANYIKRRIDEKERFALANFNLREQAYSNVYFALTKCENYFRQFIEYGNEFVEHKEPNEFAPLSDLTELINTFDINEIWLHKYTIEKMKNLFGQSSILCNLAISIVDNNEFLEGNEVESEANKIIFNINNIKEHIRKINGMTELDKYSNKIIK